MERTCGKHAREETKASHYCRVPRGFEEGIQMPIDGRAVYNEKWGHRDCDLINAGLGEKDAWHVRHIWHGEIDEGRSR